MVPGGDSARISRRSSTLRPGRADALPRSARSARRTCDYPTLAAPHGAIRWPAGTDKMGRETIVPISPEVRSALLRVLEGRGLQGGYLFPCPTSVDRPVTKTLAGKWLRRAEAVAKLEPQ